MVFRGNIISLIKNSSWLIGQNAYFMFLGIFVTAVVTRYFGPAIFGQLNYVTAIVSLFITFSTLSMESLTAKAIIDGRTREGTILFTTIVLRCVGGLFMIALSFLTIFVLTDADIVLMQLGLIYSISLSFKVFEVFENWAHAKLQMKRVAIIRMTTFTIFSGLKLLIVFLDGSIVAYAFVFIIDSILTGIALILLYFFTREGKSRMQFSLVYTKEVLSRCYPIAFSGMMVMVYMRIDQVMLGSILQDKSEVGIYAAAVNIAGMWYFVPLAVINSLMPIIMKFKASQHIKQYLVSIRALYSVTFLLSFAFGIVISMFSGLIINVIYGNDFSDAGSVLAISVWAGTFAMLGSARSVWLVNENLQKYTFASALAGCIVNVLLNIILIPSNGPIGAAIASVFAQFFNIMVLLLFPRTRSHTVLLLQSLSPMYIVKAIKERIYIKQTD